jgi:hypothetical protein
VKIAVKSFRLYPSHQPDFVTPSRWRDDYSPDELAEFKRKFQREARRRSRQLPAFFFGLAIGGIGVFAGILQREGLNPVLLAGSILAGLISTAYGAMYLAFPRCPACRNELEGPPGKYSRYCPSCGTEYASESGWLVSPECKACGTVVKDYGHRRYQIRHCTICGIPLDDEGV